MKTLAMIPVLCLLACNSGPSAPLKVPLRVHVLDDEGRAVADVQVWTGSELFGSTNTDGYVQGAVRVPTGETVLLNRTCPRGHDEDSQPRRLRIAAAADEQGRVQPLSVELTCVSKEVETALVVRTEVPGDMPLPVLIDGARVGQTDALGLAHILLRLPAESTVHVSLDTTGHPALRPRNPVRTFQLSTKSEVLLFDQLLGEAARPQLRRRPPTPKKMPPKRIR